MAKEFQRKYMHPTRRKLVEMVLNNSEYDKDTFVSYSDADKNINREVGDIWTDTNGVEWEQFSWGKMQKSKLTGVMSEIRNWIYEKTQCKSETCDKKKYGPTDKKLISKTGYCSNCLAEKEFRIRMDGMWEAYEGYKISQNMIAHGKDVLKQLTQALLDVKTEYEIVNEDGTIESWKMEKSVDELKAEISETIETVTKEIDEVIHIRDNHWAELKDKNYELVTPPEPYDV